MKALFVPEKAAEIWGDPRHLTASILAASTGMRLSEVQGLQIQHVHNGYVAVLHSYDDRYGLSQPKWNSVRQIPIPAKVQGSIEA